MRSQYKWTAKLDPPRVLITGIHHMMDMQKNKQVHLLWDMQNTCNEVSGHPVGLNPCDVEFMFENN